MVPVARLLALAALLGLASGCSAVCEDCFRIEIGEFDGAWTDCCDYRRQAQVDVVLIRITRTSGDAYLAGLGAACTWQPESDSYDAMVAAAYQAPMVTLDAAQVDSTSTFNVEFSEDDDVAILGVDCQPVRPEPQYPDVLLFLQDPDLGTQFDPAGYDGDGAFLRIVPEVVPP